MSVEVLLISEHYIPMLRIILT